MLDSLEDDITKGSLLFLEEKARLMSTDGKYIKTFPKGAYCLYLGYDRDIKLHLIFCEGEVFRLNSFKLMAKTYIIQN
jgi:hypothetical protein